MVIGADTIVVGAGNLLSFCCTILLFLSFFSVTVSFISAVCGWQDFGEARGQERCLQNAFKVLVTALRSELRDNNCPDFPRSLHASFVYSVPAWVGKSIVFTRVWLWSSVTKKKVSCIEKLAKLFPGEISLKSGTPSFANRPSIFFVLSPQNLQESFAVATSFKM